MADPCWRLGKESRKTFSICGIWAGNRDNRPEAASRFVGLWQAFQGKRLTCPSKGHRWPSYGGCTR
jgi:hypothetical protein